MGLNDLMKEIKQDPTTFLGEEPVESKVLNQVLALVEDKISEVKNQAVKCLGVLIRIVKESQMETVVNRLIDFSGGKDDELRDVAALALKTITSELPSDAKIAPSACAKLTPKLLTRVSDTATPPEALVEALSILSILVSRFPTHVAAATKDLHPLPVISTLLSHARPVVRKRAIITLSQFAQISQSSSFDELVNTQITPFLVPSTPIERYRNTAHFVAALVRQSPVQTAPYLDKLVPDIVAAVQKDDEELREGCLQVN
jgi:cullin-associated NEDD8-dissociated protein 1